MSVTLTSTHPRAQCVDVRAVFAGRFRFAYDEAYQAERSDLRAVESAWLTIIPCRHGRIFPWGGRRLGAYCTAGKRRTLEMIPGVTVVQGGRGCPDATVTFDVDLLDQVAAVLGARRPRRLSDEQRARFVADGARYRFRPQRTGDGAGVAPEALDSTIGLSDEEIHVGGPNEAGA